MRRQLFGIFTLLICAVWTRADAHPEFQKFIQDRSGRSINCAMCHAHSDGPEGAGRGQIGSLDEESMNRLLVARAAFEPGREIDSPILNDFGNFLVFRLGKQKILEARANPYLIAEGLGDRTDLDKDGISDAQEYLDGTHPLMKTHGDPILLFWNNVITYRFHLIMMLLATGFGIWGLGNFVSGFETLENNQKPRGKHYD